MNIMKKVKILIIFYLLIFPSGVLAHPGRTDSFGCHTCRTNCSQWGLSNGEYHCHGAKALPQPKDPVKSKFSETGGITVPAPEYKRPAVTEDKLLLVDQKVLEVQSAGKVLEQESTKEFNNSWFARMFRFIFSR